MDPATMYAIGGAVSGLAGIGSSVIGANASANQQGSANKWNLLMQMYQNEYNKPVNQMKRLREAVPVMPERAGSVVRSKTPLLESVVPTGAPTFKP